MSVCRLIILFSPLVPGFYFSGHTEKDNASSFDYNINQV